MPQMRFLLLSVLFCMIALGTSAAIAERGADPSPSPITATAEVLDAGPADVPAVAASPAEVKPAGTDELRSAYESIVRGDYLVAVGILLSLGVVLVRRYGQTPLPFVGWRLLPDWFQTDRGGVALVLLLSLLGSLGHSIAADAPWSFETLKAALAAAMVAIGGYAGLRRLVWPPDQYDYEDAEEAE